MAPSKGTDRQSFRMPPDEWREFGEATQAAGVDRSAVVRDFIRWYLGKPGAGLPDRPEASPSTVD